jgi:hypothetical protein
VSTDRQVARRTYLRLAMRSPARVAVWHARLELEDAARWRDAGEAAMLQRALDSALRCLGEANATRGARNTIAPGMTPEWCSTLLAQLDAGRMR